MSERVCGECTACCKTHLVTEIGKPPGKWCAHCIPGKGCTIYEDRPDECRSFRCEWLKGFGRDDERPDRVKYVLDFAAQEGGPEPGIMQIWEAMEGGLSRSSVQMLTRFFLAQGIWVSHLYLSGRKRLFLPEHEVVTDELRHLSKKEGFEFASL